MFYHYVIDDSLSRYIHSSTNIEYTIHQNLSCSNPDNHEVEEGLTIEEAGGSLSSVFGCLKNTKIPNYHTRFIPVTEFDINSISHLPDKFPLTKSEVVSYVKSHVPLVGRIHSSIISSNRPDTRDDGTPYLFADRKGQTYFTVGSGWVTWMDGPLTDDDCQLCAGKCQERYWRIDVHTAKHVIFDNQEAQACTFVLFDDFDDGRGKVSLSGWRYKGGEIEPDYSRMDFHTHDEALANMLKDKLNISVDMRRRVNETFCSVGLDITRPIIMAVIAHPHARKKHISIGNYKGKGVEYKEGKRWGDTKAVKYSCATCSGSSGGLVLEIGLQDVELAGKRYATFKHPHSGATHDLEVGISCNWWRWI